jgi:hypothetical protein
VTSRVSMKIMDFVDMRSSGIPVFQAAIARALAHGERRGPGARAPALPAALRVRAREATRLVLLNPRAEGASSPRLAA